MSASSVLLDVNVPMYAAGQDHPYREACSWILMEVANGRLSVAINAETIQEVLYRYGALQQWNTGAVLAASLLELVPIIYPVLAEDARLAIELFRRYAPHGLRARDVLHVAVMQNNGISEIISVDHHFDRVEGIVRLDPRDLFQRAQNHT